MLNLHFTSARPIVISYPLSFLQTCLLTYIDFLPIVIVLMMFARLFFIFIHILQSNLETLFKKGEG